MGDEERRDRVSKKELEKRPEREREREQYMKTVVPREKFKDRHTMREICIRTSLDSKTQ
jgi:hypothetical protein